MKKLTSVVLVAGALAFAGCGEDGDSGQTTVQNQSEISVAAETSTSGGGSSATASFKNTTTVDTEVGEVKVEVKGEAKLNDQGFATTTTGTVSWEATNDLTFKYTAPLNDLGEGKAAAEYKFSENTKGVLEADFGKDMVRAGISLTFPSKK